MKFNERIKGLRIQNSLTQKELGEKIGVSTVTIRSWETGEKQPSMSAIISLAKIFETTSDYLLGISGDSAAIIIPTSRSESALLKNYRLLDVYGKKIVTTVCEMEAERMLRVYAAEEEQEIPDNIRYIKKFTAPAAAGYATPVEGEDYEWIPVDDNTPSATDFAVKIQGDSMYPYIQDGDTVFVHQCYNELRNGDVGIFCVDGSTYCKIFYKDEDMNITLVSANPDMSDSNVSIPYDSGISYACFGKVLLKHRIPIPDYFRK